MAIREGRWDCPSCGSRAIYGRHVDCPGCGKPRPAGIRFYLTDGAPAVTDAARLAEASAGADWICEHCAASNRAALDACGGCGAPRGSSPSQPVIDYATANVPRSADAQPGRTADPAPAEGADPGPSADENEPAAPDAPSGDGTPGGPEDPVRAKEVALGCAWGCWPLWAGLAALVLGFAWKRVDRGIDPQPAYVTLDLRVYPGTVTRLRWEREITLEERSIVEGEGFSLPDSAEVLSRERAIERYDEQLDGYRTEVRQVERGRRTVTGSRTRTREVSERVEVGTRTYVCGQRDLGNGYFEDVTCEDPVYETRTRTETYEEPVSGTEPEYEEETERVPVYRSVPVYGTLYRWRGPRWMPLAPVVARGDTAAPAWPEVALAPNQRVAARRERHFAVVAFHERVVEIELSPDDRARYRPGQLVGVGGNDGGWRLVPAGSVTECVEWRAGKRALPPAEYRCQERMAPAAPPVPAWSPDSATARPADPVPARDSAAAP